jgi:hypothetical protein
MDSERVKGEGVESERVKGEGAEGGERGAGGTMLKCMRAIISFCWYCSWLGVGRGIFLATTETTRADNASAPRMLEVYVVCVRGVCLCVNLYRYPISCATGLTLYSLVISWTGGREKIETPRHLQGVRLSKNTPALTCGQKYPRADMRWGSYPVATRSGW